MTWSDTWRLQQDSGQQTPCVPPVPNPGLVAFALANPRTNASSRVVPSLDTDGIPVSFTGFANLPTTLPALPGQLWLNGGVLQVS